MGKEVCAFADLVDLDLICVVDPGWLILPYDKYPRRTWWKLWEKHRTRDEYIIDMHTQYAEDRTCHTWEGKPFHFCVQPESERF